VEVLSSIPNLKQWLRLRDRHAAFDDAKAQGYAGFPALLLDDDRVILDESKLKEIF
jgi:glutaredoxin-related protein